MHREHPGIVACVPEREIIVVDDGSEDSPLNDLLRFGDAYVYLRTANGGVSTARNRGLQIANGQYIQFVDGDDMLISNVYEHCLDIARYGKADMVMFDFSHSTEADTEYYCDTTPQAEGIQRRLDDNLKVIRSLNTTADTLPPEERVALQRRVAQLTMDYIYNTIVLTRDSQAVRRPHRQVTRVRGCSPYPTVNTPPSTNGFAV